MHVFNIDWLCVGSRAEKDTAVIRVYSGHGSGEVMKTLDKIHCSPVKLIAVSDSDIGICLLLYQC